MAKIDLYKGSGDLKGWVFVPHGDSLLAVCKEADLPQSVEGIGEMILSALAMEQFINLEVKTATRH